MDKSVEREWCARNWGWHGLRSFLFLGRTEGGGRRGAGMVLEGWAQTERWESPRLSRVHCEFSASSRAGTNLVSHDPCIPLELQQKCGLRLKERVCWEGWASQEAKPLDTGEEGREALKGGCCDDLWDICQAGRSSFDLKVRILVFGCHMQPFQHGAGLRNWGRGTSMCKWAWRELQPLWEPGYP